jgi:hypothetical protein
MTEGKPERQLVQPRGGSDEGLQEQVTFELVRNKLGYSSFPIPSSKLLGA